jgi:hypothetical protein
VAAPEHVVKSTTVHVRRVALGVLLAAALITATVEPGVPVAWSGTLPSVDTPASGSFAPALRLRFWRCERIVIVGDSLTVAADPYHRSELDGAGLLGLVDGRNGRRIPATTDPANSGVLTAELIRQEWGEADCWVIGLGTNDVNVNAISVTSSAALIEQQVAVLTPSARVWWINVANRATETSTARSDMFNQALAERAAGDRSFRVIDWATLFDANPAWSSDGVHVGTTGSRARASLVAAALEP